MGTMNKTGTYNKTGSYGANSLRGHLALNSSPLKPCINKLSSQDLIQDQMTSHYYNLATIKSAIDTRAPKSTTLSIKKRDQVKRNAVLKQMKSGRSTGGHVVPSTKAKKHLTATSLDFTDEPFVAGRPHTASSSWSPSHYNSSSFQHPYPRPKTASSFTHRKSIGTEKLSPRSAENATRKHVLDVTYGGDYLDRHQERFQNKDGAPFTPRTKKRSAKSFLSQSKHYAPPVHSQKKKSPEKTKSPREDYKKITKDDVRGIDDGADRSTDHRKWIEEQNEFVQRLSQLEQVELEKSMKKNRSRPASACSSARQRINDEEEELKYLQFVNEVTNDILSTGIYSDTILHRLMKRHVERRRHDLCVKKMWIMLEKLKEDLDMSNQDEKLLSTNRVSSVRTSGHSSPSRSEVSRSSRYNSYAKETSVKATAIDENRLNETASTFPTVTSENWTKVDGGVPEKGSSLKKSFVEDEKLESLIEQHYSSAALAEASSAYRNASPSSSNKPTRPSYEESVKSASVHSFQSTSSKPKVESEHDIYEKRYLNEVQDDFSGLKSHSASSFGSRASASILRRPHPSADVVKDTAVKQGAKERVHQDEVSGLKSHSASSLGSTTSASSLRKSRVSAVKDPAVEPEAEVRVKLSGIRSHSGSSLGSRTSAGSLFRKRNVEDDALEKPESPFKADPLDEPRAVFDPESSVLEQSVEVEDRGRTSSRTSIRSSSMVKDGAAEPVLAVPGVQEAVSGIRSDSASSLGSRAPASSLRKSHAGSDAGKDDSSVELPSKTSSLEKYKEEFAAPQPSSRFSENAYNKLADEPTKSSTSQESSHDEVDVKRASLSSIRSSSSRSKVQDIGSIKPIVERKLYQEETVGVDTHSTSSLGSRKSANSLSREKPVASSSDFWKTDLSKDHVKGVSVDDEDKSQNSESLTKSVFSEPYYLYDKSPLDDDILGKPSGFQSFVSEDIDVRSPSVGSIKSSSSRSKVNASSIPPIEQPREVRTNEETSEIKSHSLSSLGSVTSANSLRKEGGHISAVDSLLNDENDKVAASANTDEDVFENLEDSLSRQSVRSDASSSKRSVIAAPRRSVQALPRTTFPLDKPQPLVRRKRSKDSLDEVFGERLSSLNDETRMQKDNGSLDDKVSHEKLEENKLITDDDDSSHEKREVTSTRSFLDEIRDAALKADHDSSQGTEDESDYESIAALSMTIRPGGDVKPLQTSSGDFYTKPKLTKQIAQTSVESTKHSPKEETLSLTEKDEYSDDFDDDSDNF